MFLSLTEERTAVQQQEWYILVVELLCIVTEIKVSCPRQTVFGCYWQTNFGTCTTTGFQHSYSDPDLNLY